MKQKIIAANWKMNKTNQEAKEFFEEFNKLVTGNLHQVIICTPFTTISTVKSLGKKLKIMTGAQNLHPAKNGTYTGEISADMLVDAGVQAVIIGHSERREQFKETDAFINEKVKTGLMAGLKVILCVGETAEEREKGKMNSVIKRQLIKGLDGVTDSKNLIIAYEPIWAISSGDPSKPKPIATKEQIEEAHGLIMDILAKVFPKDFIPILYGGSANDKNAQEIFNMIGVDGALVGGASLDPAKFAAMVNTVH